MVWNTVTRMEEDAYDVGQHDDQDEDSPHAILIADVYKTKSDEGEREAPLKQDETRRNQKKAKTNLGEDDAEGELSRRRRRSRRPRQKEETEEDEDRRSTMPAYHRQNRSDGKADEEAKYREGECQENEEETLGLPQKAH